VANLDAILIIRDRGGGGGYIPRGVRIPGWGARSLFSVVLRGGLEVLESLTLGEDAQLEFVACYVEEGVFRAEDLSEEGVIKLVEPCSGDAYKGEFHWEKGDGDLHIPGEGWGEVGEDGRRYIYLCRGGADLEYLSRLAKDLPSFHHLNRCDVKLNAETY